MNTVAPRPTATAIATSALPAITPPRGSFVPQRVDRRELRGLARRVEAEEDADRRGEAERQQDRADPELGAPARELADRDRRGRADHDADQAADQRERHGLDEELRQDVA